MEQMENELKQDTFKKRLACNLTRAQVEEKTAQYFSLVDQIDEAGKNIDEALKRHKEEKARLEARKVAMERDASILRNQIKTREEIKEIDCREIPNHAAQIIETHRLDFKPGKDGRVIDSRPMNLIDIVESTPEAQQEAEALADAETERITAAKKKGRAKKGDDSATAAAEKKASKKGNGKAPHSDDDYELPASAHRPPLSEVEAVDF